MNTPHPDWTLVSLHLRAPLAARREKTRGFALIIAILMMGFILMLTVGLSMLVGTEIAASQHQQAKSIARQNAMYGLLTALGELQAYAGADQRATGTAELTDSALKDAEGTRYWTGVWSNANSPSADATSPTLLNWLVSGNEHGNAKAFSPGDVAVGSDDVITLVGAGSVIDKTGYVVAPLVQMGVADEMLKGRYAFWVGDEGVKGNIALTSGAHQRNAPDDSAYGKNAQSRLYANQSVAAGGALITTAVSGNGDRAEWPQYTLSNQNFLHKIEALNDVADLNLVTGSPAEIAPRRWHDITTASAGLQTDSRRGGLKTDLSLAFEQDDTAFGASGLLSRSEDGHIYRHNGIYGPKWKLLRDYYRLYKNVTTPAAAPALQAEIISMNIEDPEVGIPFAFGEGSFYRSDSKISNGDPFKTRKTAPIGSVQMPVGTTGKPAERERDAIFPEQMKLAPVVAEIKFLVSTDSVAITPETLVVDGQDVTVDRQMRLIFDPVVKLWNPYNVALTFEAFTVRVSHLPIGFHWTVEHQSDSGGIARRDYKNSSHNGFVPLRDLLRRYYEKKGVNNYHDWAYWLDSMVFTIGSGNGITLQPGEVKIFSCDYGAPIPLDRSLDLVEGWNSTRGGFVLDQMHIDTDTVKGGTSAIPYLIKANADSTFQVRMSTETGPSGWSSLRFYTFLFRKGAYANRGKVYNTGTAGTRNYYNTSTIHASTSSVPFESISHGNSTNAPTNTAGSFDVPESNITSSRQYLLAIELRLKAADTERTPVPLAQFSPTAYVHNAQYNSLNFTGSNPPTTSPAYSLHYRRINSGFDVDLQLNGSNGYYGASHGTSGETHVPLLDIPSSPIFSIGQLQSADTSIHSSDPLLAIGNSFRSSVVAPDKISESVNVAPASGFSDNRRSRSDNSYLLNRELWDSYFFSTITPAESALFTPSRTFVKVLQDFAAGTTPLINPNLRPYRPVVAEMTTVLASDDVIAPAAADRAAAFLVQDGQFNINSTSIEAWRSLLGSTFGDTVQYRSKTANLTPDSAAGAGLSRFALPFGGADGSGNWQGFRRLSKTEIDDLSKAIVAQIQKRGPMLTLSDFVNRDFNGDPKKGGILEEALAQTSINSGFSRSVSASDLAFYLPNADARQAVAGPVAQGAAQYLLPGDILGVIGHRLAPRSDTFRVRAYGEVLSPASTEPEARAWIEAIIQRVPDYVDGSQTPWETASGQNATFGRKFIIRSIRFLSEDEV